MKTAFYIIISLKTGQENEDFGRFYIGSNREQAYKLFDRLEGVDDIGQEDVLYIHFMETRELLPFNLKTITCTLPQLEKNCGIITKHVFRYFNFGW